MPTVGNEHFLENALLLFSLVPWNDDTLISDFLQAVLTSEGFTDKEIEEEYENFNRLRIKKVGRLRKMTQNSKEDFWQKIGLSMGAEDAIKEALGGNDPKCNTSNYFRHSPQ